MEPFHSVCGFAIPFGVSNVDTDTIIPSHWMKVITRSGLGRGAFEALRRDPANIFDSARNRGAPILIAGENFGCGSSREHAPWALRDMGLQAVIAPSFADIFAGNAAKNGLALVVLPRQSIDRLMAVADIGVTTVDLEQNLVTTSLGDCFPFTMDTFRRRCLLEGLDEIAIIEEYQSQIAVYEGWVRAKHPWMAAPPARVSASRPGCCATTSRRSVSSGLF